MSARSHLVTALVLLFGLSLALPLAVSQAQNRSAEVESLTMQLLDLNTQYHVAPPAKQSQLLNELIRVVLVRKGLLADLIENDPKEALRLGMPEHSRTGLHPKIQAHVEEALSAEGTLQILHEDRDQDSRYLHFLWAGPDTRYSLHFASEPRALKTGDHVRVTGLHLNGAVALSGSNMTVLAAALPNTLGAQKTLMILVNFQDNAAQPYTTTDALSVLSTTSGFDMENSYQQTWLTSDVAGWFTIPLSSSVCDYGTLASYANSAATAAGFNLSAYLRHVYAFPSNACGWWGLGTVGGNPSQAWINGSLQLRVLGHEMGHNLGLYHSHAWQCAGSTLCGGNATSIEYGDTVDIMGGSTGHFNAFQKQRLGWLNSGASPPTFTVQGSGTYTLDPYENTGTNPKALKILKDATSKTWYYVEYRVPAGYDYFLGGYSNVLNGVVIHTGSDNDANSSELLDMTPDTSSWYDPALDVGLTFSDPAAGVTISTQSVSGSSAVVTVSVTPPPCVHTSPSVVLSPSSQTATAGTPLSYTVSVTNNDGSSCSGSTFTLTAVDPSGWTGNVSASSLSINPGTTARTTLTITSPTTAGNGTYMIGSSATNTADSTVTGSGSAADVVGTVTTPPCQMKGKSGKCR